MSGAAVIESKQLEGRSAVLYCLASGSIDQREWGDIYFAK